MSEENKTTDISKIFWRLNDFSNVISGPTEFHIKVFVI